MKKWLSIIAATVILGGGAIASMAEEARKLYAVVFAVTIDGDEVTSFQVSRVTEPLTRSDAPVKVAVPEVFVSAARAKFEANRKRASSPGAGRETFFTYYYFDPSQPDNADVDPKRGNR
jgi:hypothetical protein